MLLILAVTPMLARLVVDRPLPQWLNFALALFAGLGLLLGDALYPGWPQQPPLLATWSAVVGLWTADTFELRVRAPRGGDRGSS